MQRPRTLTLLILLACLVPSTTLAQHAPAPADRMGEALTVEPSYQGVNAQASIDVDKRRKNEGGIDGAGLCVIASNVAILRQQGHSAEAEKLWAEAKRRMGGYSPDKFDRLAAQIPGLPKYFHYEGSKFEFVEGWLAKGHAVGITYGTGREYNYFPIAHMVTLCHFDKSWAAVLDNNYIGQYSWMPRPELERRARMAGGVWAMAWPDHRNRPIIPLPGGGGLSERAVASLVLSLGLIVAMIIATPGKDDRHEHAAT